MVELFESVEMVEFENLTNLQDLNHRSQTPVWECLNEIRIMIKLIVTNLGIGNEKNEDKKCQTNFLFLIKK